jgi:hypothetical protein
MAHWIENLDKTSMNPIHLHLRDWSPESLTIEAHFDAHESGMPMPKPGEFIQAVGPSGHVFYLLVDALQANETPNRLILKTTPIKGYPEFPVHHARSLSGPAYLNTLRPNSNDDEPYDAQEPTVVIAPNVQINLHQLGDWVFVHSLAQDTLSSFIQAEIDHGRRVLALGNHTETETPSSQDIVLGQDCFLTLRLIRSDRLIEALTSDLPAALQDPCNRFLHEQFAALPEEATLEDVLTFNPEAWAAFSFGRPLKEKLAALQPYFDATKTASSAKTSKKTKASKRTDNSFELPLETKYYRLVLPTLSDDLQAIVYMGSLGLIQTAFQNPSSPNCRMVLHHPEWSPQTIRHFLGVTPNPVILVSPIADPWLSLVDDAILASPKQPDTLWLCGQLTGGVTIPIQTNSAGDVSNTPLANTTWPEPVAAMPMPSPKRPQQLGFQDSPEVATELAEVFENPFSEALFETGSLSEIEADRVDQAQPASKDHPVHGFDREKSRDVSVAPESSTPFSEILPEAFAVPEPFEAESETVIDDWSLQSLVEQSDLSDVDDGSLTALLSEMPAQMEEIEIGQNDFKESASPEPTAAISESFTAFDTLSQEETFAEETHPDMSLEPFEFETLSGFGQGDNSEHNPAQWALTLDTPEAPSSDEPESNLATSLESPMLDSQDWLTLDSDTTTEVHELTLDDVAHETPEHLQNLEALSENLELDNLQQDLSTLDGFDMSFGANANDSNTSESGLLEAAALASDFDLPSLTLDMNAEAGLPLDMGPLVADEPAPMSLDETLAIANQAIPESSEWSESVSEEADSEALTGDLSNLLSASFEMPEAHQHDVINTTEHVLDMNLDDLAILENPNSATNSDDASPPHDLMLGDLDSFSDLGDFMTEVGNTDDETENTQDALTQTHSEATLDYAETPTHHQNETSHTIETDDLGNLDFGDLDSLLAQTEEGSEEFITPDWASSSATSSQTDAQQALPVVKATTKATPRQDYQAGQRVAHPNYGEGVVKKVMQMYDDQIVLNIQFDAVGKRLLDPSLCDLKSLTTAP